MAFVILGISGGVDSSVSALLLKKQGYRVRGVYFVMDETHTAGIENARLAAADAGIEFDTVDLRGEFRKNVTEPFVSEYMSGRTPNPCVFCNKHIKFPFLLKYADSCGGDFIATGHYASVENRNGIYYIARGADTFKDQSYFLYPLGQNILSRLIFPLSSYTKEQVRALAAEYGLSAASKKDSQDICFIPDGDSGLYVKNAVRDTEVPDRGLFTDRDGKELGKHRGIFNYTVGQRRGLGIASDAPLYVIKIDTTGNRVILGREKELYSDRICLTDVCWACPEADAPADEDAVTEADVCIRYSKKTAPAQIRIKPGNEAELFFETPQRAPAPGQSAVFYRENCIIGGGIIK